MQYLESVEVDSSVPLTHHDPKDLGSWFSKATQNPFSDSFRFQNPFLDFLKKPTLRHYRGFKFALCRRFVFRFASVQFCFQNLPCTPPPHHAPFNKKKWNGPSKSIVLAHGGQGTRESEWGVVTNSYVAFSEYAKDKNGMLSRFNLKEKRTFSGRNWVNWCIKYFEQKT